MLSGHLVQMYVPGRSLPCCYKCKKKKKWHSNVLSSFISEDLPLFDKGRLPRRPPMIRDPQSEPSASDISRDDKSFFKNLFGFDFWKPKSWFIYSHFPVICMYWRCHICDHFVLLLDIHIWLRWIFNCDPEPNQKFNSFMEYGPEVVKLFSCSTQLSMKFLKAHNYENI